MAEHPNVMIVSFAPVSTICFPPKISYFAVLAHVRCSDRPYPFSK